MTQTQKKADDFVLLCSLILAFLCVILKIGQAYFPGMFLFGEDGTIFINQASSLGIDALWTSYAGYLHLYNRLVAFICNFFSLGVTAYVFIFAWLICFCAMIAVIVKRALSFQLPNLYIYWLIILITLQPTTTGEVFLNLTNSQWPLWAAFGLYLLTRDKIKPSLLELYLITLGAFSGSFCLFIFPIFFLKSLIEKSLKNTWALNLILFFGSILISYGLYNRATAYTHIGLIDRIHTLIYVLFFSANGLAAYAAASFFWVCTLVCSIRVLLTNHSRQNKITLLSLFAFAGICLIAGIDATAIAFLNLPVTVPDRYTWIPYTLFFFSAAIAAAACSRRMLILTFLSITAVCAIHFQTIFHKTNYQFKSYANFSNYADIIIPINPGIWWNINRIFITPTHPSVLPQKLDIRNFSANGLKAEMANDVIGIQANTRSASLTFNTPIYCPSAADIGVELRFTREPRDYGLTFYGELQQRMVKLFWSNTKVFHPEASLSYYIPGKEVRAQFAFPNNKEKIYLRFNPMNTTDKIQIKSLHFYCLP